MDANEREVSTANERELINREWTRMNTNNQPRMDASETRIINREWTRVKHG
jgi:hypothetical protein